MLELWRKVHHAGCTPATFDKVWSRDRKGRSPTTKATSKITRFNPAPYHLLLLFHCIPTTNIPAYILGISRDPIFLQGQEGHFKFILCFSSCSFPCFIQPLLLNSVLFTATQIISTITLYHLDPSILHVFVACFALASAVHFPLVSVQCFHSTL